MRHSRAVKYLLISSFAFLSAPSLWANGGKPPKKEKDPEIENPKDEILEKYHYVDTGNVINKEALSEALKHYDTDLNKSQNTEFLTVIDFSKHSNEQRFYLIDMESGNVETYKTAHGKNSDKNNDGFADAFSNRSGSKMSSLGLYRAAETYYGKHGYSLRLDGLSASNSKARPRAIVIHGADYVKESGAWTGRSWGCPALDRKHSKEIIDHIKEGSLIYAWDN